MLRVAFVKDMPGDALDAGLTLGLHICGKNTRQATKYRGFTAIERKSWDDLEFVKNSAYASRPGRKST